MAGNDSDTILLLHCDGTDNATSFPDSSVGGATHTVTAVGDANTATVEKQFGTASAEFDGTVDHLSVPSHTDFNFGTGDFTIDCWVYFSSLSNVTIIDRNNAVSFQIFYYHDGTSLYLYVNSSQINVPWTPSINTWYHIAMVRESGTVTGYVGGNSILSGSLSGNVNETEIVYIGGAKGGGDLLNGYIDEFRISKVARWSENFAVPTAPYAAEITGNSPMMGANF